MICVNPRNEAVQSLIDKYGEKVVRAMARAVAADTTVYITNNGKVVESELYKKVRGGSKTATEAWDTYVSAYSKDFTVDTTDANGEPELTTKAFAENKFISNGRENIAAKTSQLKIQFPGTEIVVEDTNTLAKISTKDGVQTITVSKDLIGVPFAWHEHAVIQVAANGGVNSLSSKNGIALLKNSKLYQELLATFPENSEDTTAFKEAVLSEAIAYEGDLWERNQAVFNSKWKSWKSAFYTKVTKELGKSQTTLKLNARTYLDSLIAGVKAPRKYSQSYRDLNPNSSEIGVKDIAFQKILNLIKANEKRIKDYAERRGTNSKLDAKMHTLIEALAKNDSTKTLLEYLRYVSNYSSSQANAISRLDANLEGYMESTEFTNDIENFKTFLDFTEHIEDLVNIVASSPDLSKMFEENKLQYVVQKALADRKTVETRMNDLIKQKAFGALVPRYIQHGKHLAIYTDEKEAEFNKVNPPVKGASKKQNLERRKARVEYVKKAIADNQDLLEQRARSEVARMLDTVDFDITKYEHVFFGGRSANNTPIQLVMDMYDDIELDKQKIVDAWAVQAEEVFDKFFTYVKDRKTLTEMYDEMLEDKIELDVDGNPVFKNGKVVKAKGKASGYVERHYLKQFEDKRKELENELENAKANLLPTVEELEAKLEKWYRDNASIDPTTGYMSPNSKWTNAQYDDLVKLRDKDSPIAKAYDWLRSVQDDADGRIPYEGLRLNNSIPMREKSFYERRDNFGSAEAVKMWFNDLKKVTADYQESGDMTGRDMNMKKVRSNMRRIKRIPLHYRRSIEDSDVSHDLFTSVMLNMDTSFNYSEMRNIQATTEFIRDTLAKADVRIGKGIETDYMEGDEAVPSVDVIEKNGVKRSIRFETKKGADSEFLKVFDTMQDTNLYGIRNTSSILATKVSSAAKQYFSQVLLGSNMAASAKNITVATVQNFIESHSGDTTISKADWYKAHKDYYGVLGANLIKHVGDIGRRVPQSKVNIMLRRYNAMSDWQPLNREFEESNFFRKHGKLEYAGYAGSVPEHAAQSMVVLAVMNSIKVDGPQGELGMYDAMTEEGGMVAGYEITEEMERKAAKKIKDLVGQLHINLDPRNQGAINMTWGGRYIQMFRKWIPLGGQRRWRGIGNAGDQKFFNLAQGRFEEGLYTTSFRFMKGLFTDAVKLRRGIAVEQLTNWENLNDFERAAIRKTVIELGTAFVLWAIATLAYGKWKDSDDEEERKRWAWLAYLTKSTSQELSFYAYPPNTLQILKNPSVMIKMMDSILNLGSASLPWNITDVYTTGQNSGQSKWLKAVGDLTPVYKGLLGRDIELMNQYVFK